VADFIKARADKYLESEMETQTEADIAEALAADFSDKDFAPLDLENINEDIDDELYEEAKDMVIKAGKASASLLQRRLRIGYARAARLLDIMEERGLVGPVDGAKPREVYVKTEERTGNFENNEGLENIPIVDKK
jgi:S-DNA-T family DNA segregation ATPase FtsK/SpoIIIE